MGTSLLTSGTGMSECVMWYRLVSKPLLLAIIQVIIPLQSDSLTSFSFLHQVMKFSSEPQTFWSPLGRN